jgi:translation elongation factor EF-Ts
VETSVVWPAGSGAAVLSAVGRTYSRAVPSLYAQAAFVVAKTDKGENMNPEGSRRPGGVFVYRHFDGSLGSILVLVCDTDFLARSEVFVRLGENLAVQVAAMNPASVEELLAQPFIRDGSMTICQLIAETAEQARETIQVREFRRLSVR